MKKFINAVDTLRWESLCGFAAAHADIVTLNPEPLFVIRRNPPAGSKVALLSGGGSGHEPLHTGFVGVGMLDAACPGHIFTSPGPDQIAAAARAAECGRGVLFIVKNFAGDVMNFEMGAELHAGPSRTVIVADDVAGRNDPAAARRGVAGTLIVEKIAGAAAEAGLDLDRCASLAERVIAVTRSMGVALTSCTVPALGTPTFEIGATQMEVGVGIHGERGYTTKPLAPADEIVRGMLDAISSSIDLESGRRVLVLVNGFGATPLIELYLVYDAVRRTLDDRGLVIARSLVGSFVTSLDMAGFSLTITLLDDELTRYWDAPVHTAALRWGS